MQSLKAAVFVIFAIFVVSLLCLLCAGCASSPAGTVATGTITEHTRRVTELEAENAQLRERLDKYDSAVSASIERFSNLGTRAGEVGSDIGGIIKLFDLYQRGVEQQLSDYRKLQSEIGLQPQNK